MVGFARMIGDIYEGSTQSKIALELYGQTRDEVLTTDIAKAFARGTASLTLLKGPPPLGGYSAIQPWSPIYPPPGFLYEYAYPGDMLELRALIPTRDALPQLDPRPSTWRIDNDLTPIVSGNPPLAAGPPQKVILTNRANATAVYRRRVTNLLLWEPSALAAFVARLAAKFASSPAIAASPDMMKQAPAEAVYTANVARGHRG